jgi:hypothetical protein
MQSGMFLIATLALSTLSVTSSFTLQKNDCNLFLSGARTKLFVKSETKPIPVNVSGQGFEKKEEVNYDDDEEVMKALILKMKPTQLKKKLLDLLPRMTGTKEEFKQVELYVNALEDKFVPPQTLDFLNLAMIGEWQFLFTNQLGRPSPKLRLTELVQKIEVDGFDGKITNKASWDLAEDGAIFDARGTFASSMTYKINQGARMTINKDLDLGIELSRGSVVPKDPQGLVGLINRAMPTELFDSTDLAMDTTYLDTDIRIVRFTGSRHEGVRDIFMRKGLIEINPSGMDS